MTVSTEYKPSPLNVHCTVAIHALYSMVLLTQMIYVHVAIVHAHFIQTVFRQVLDSIQLV